MASDIFATNSPPSDPKQAGLEVRGVRLHLWASEGRATLIKAVVINPHAPFRETRCCLRAGAERVQTPPRSTTL